MTSKKSFLANLKTNLRRRVWLWVILILSLTFSMPMLLAMMLSTEKMYYSYNNLSMHLGRVFAMQVGLNGGMSFLVSVLAVISAVQGFSYMYQRKKLDMYMSVPVSKEVRFTAIYLNGILPFFAVYFVNLGLSFLVAQAMGANIFLAFGEALAAVIGNSILYFAVYHIALLAVMLTGNKIVTLLGTGALLFYDSLMLMLLDTYKSTFFSSYFYKSADKLKPFFISPVIRFTLTFDECFTYTYNYTQERTMDWNVFLKGMIPVMLVSVLMLVLAYWCYTKKPAEVCGKAMAFPKTKAVIKILLTVLAGLSGGMIFYGLSGSSMVFMVLGLVVGTLFCHGVVEVIYDFDIRSIKNGWKSLLISGAIVGVIFSIFHFDIIGYDSYVPEASQVESLAFAFPDTYETFYNEDLEGVGIEEYIFENMEITDIEPVLKLAQLRMGMERPEAMEGNIGQYRSCVVKYELKNGEEVYRCFPTEFAVDMELLNEIVTDPAYQQAAYLIYNEPLLQIGDKLEFSYDNGSGQQEITAFSLEELKAAYRKDLENLTFTVMAEQCVKGRFSLDGILDNEYVGGFLPIYPSFENVNALLERAGLDHEYYVNMDDVEKIVIQNDNHELMEAYAEDEYQLRHDFMVEEAFTERSELEQIIPALYPDTYTDYWMPEGKLNTGYYVTVYYKPDARVNSEVYINYYMLEDKIPDFVRERTTYSE